MRALLLLLLLALSAYPLAHAQRRRDASGSEFTAVYKNLEWSFVGPAQGEHTVHIGLPLSNTELVQKLHDDRSNPLSPNFQQWLSEDELLAYTAPDPELVAATRDWIASLSPTNVEEIANGAAFAVTAPVDTFQAAFQTTLAEYSHPKHGTVIRKVGSHQTPSVFQSSTIAIAGIYDIPETKDASAVGKDAPPNILDDSLFQSKTQGFHRKRSIHQEAQSIGRKGSRKISKVHTTPAPSAEDVERRGGGFTTFPGVSTSSTPTEHESTTFFSSIPSSPNPSTVASFIVYRHDSLVGYIYPRCWDGSAMSGGVGPSACGAKPGDDKYPVMLQAFAFDCGPLPFTRNDTCVSHIELVNDQLQASRVVTIRFSATSENCGFYQGDTFYCLVYFPVNPNTQYQVCYATVYNDGTTSLDDGGLDSCLSPVPTETATTPQLLKNLYHINQGMRATSSQTNAIMGFSPHGLGWTAADLDFYLDAFGYAPAVPVEVFDYQNYISARAHGSASVNVQVLAGMAPGAQMLYLNTPYKHTPWWYLFATVVAGYGKDKPQPFGPNPFPRPDVLVIPAGTAEFNMDGNSINLAEWWMMILATRGTTVLTIVGNSGYAGSGNCNSTGQYYPGTSLYATSVGATALSGAAQPYCVAHPEVCDPTPTEIVCNACAANIITSGGGYSDELRSASYMSHLQDAYTGYLQSDHLRPYDVKSKPTAAQGYRGVPDISLIGANYATALHKKFGFGYWFGTGISAATMGGIVTLLNTALAPYGRTMGSMNQFLYHIAAAYPQAFNDIVVGDNACSQYHSCSKGFYATPGWDAVSGLGSPNFDVLVKLAIDPTGSTLYGHLRDDDWRRKHHHN